MSNDTANNSNLRPVNVFSLILIAIGALFVSMTFFNQMLSTMKSMCPHSRSKISGMLHRCDIKMFLLIQSILNPMRDFFWKDSTWKNNNHVNYVLNDGVPYNAIFIAPHT